LVVFRVTNISDNEFIQYDNIFKESKTISIFKEFDSTSKNKEIPYNYLKNDNSKQLFWEITIPIDIIKSESSNLVDVSGISEFQTENEILIRSRAVFKIHEIIEMR